MNWTLNVLPEAAEDVKALDGSVRPQVVKAIQKVLKNPLPVDEGGLGRPLGNNAETNLTGLLKIKLKKSGIRIVYDVIRDKDIMRVIIIGMRKDEEVYKEAYKRIRKHNLI